MIRTRHVLLAGLALAAAILVTPSARADIYGTSTYLGGHTISINGTLNNPDSTSESFSGGYYTTYGTTLTGDSSYSGISYCVDLTHSTGSSAKLADSTEVANGPLPLTNSFANLTSSPTNVATDNAGFGRAAWIANTFGAGLSNGATMAAVQIAVWVAEYASSSWSYVGAAGNITSITANGGSYGTVTFSGNKTDLSKAYTYLTTSMTAGGGSNFATASAYWVDYEKVTGGHHQFQLITAVPEPSALAIAGLGLLGFVGYGVRRQRRRV